MHARSKPTYNNFLVTEIKMFFSVSIYTCIRVRICYIGFCEIGKISIVVNRAHVLTATSMHYSTTPCATGTDLKFLIKKKKKSREIDQETFPTPKSLLLTYKLKPSVPCRTRIVVGGFAAYRYLNCMRTIRVITTIRVSLGKFTFKIEILPRHNQ